MQKYNETPFLNNLSVAFRYAFEFSYFGWGIKDLIKIKLALDNTLQENAYLKLVAPLKPF